MEMFSSYGISGSYWRTLIAVIFALISFLANAIILQITNERVPRDQDPLPDLAFNISSSAHLYIPINLSDYLVVGQSFRIILLLFIHKYRLIIIRRLSLLVGILYFFRAFCLLLTQLPLPGSKLCYVSHDNSSIHNLMITSTGQQLGVIDSHIFTANTSLGLSVDGIYQCHGDYIYSRHTVILTLSYLILREYLIPIKCHTILWKLFNAFAFTWSFVGVISLIITRRHYFIDILLAYYITTRLFWTYHTMCYTRVLRSNSSSNYLSRAWWWPIFKYLEDDLHVANSLVHVNYNLLNDHANDHVNNRVNNHVNCHINGHLNNCVNIDQCNCRNLELPKVPRSFEWPLSWSLDTFQIRKEQKII